MRYYIVKLIHEFILQAKHGRKWWRPSSLSHCGVIAAVPPIIGVAIITNISQSIDSSEWRDILISYNLTKSDNSRKSNIGGLLIPSCADECDLHRTDSSVFHRFQHSLVVLRLEILVYGPQIFSIATTIWTLSWCYGRHVPRISSESSAHGRIDDLDSAFCGVHYHLISLGY